MFVRRFAGIGNQLRRSVYFGQLVRSASSSQQHAVIPEFSIDDIVGKIEQQEIKAPTVKRNNTKIYNLRDIAAIFNKQSKGVLKVSSELNEEERNELMRKVTQKTSEISDVSLLIELLKLMPEKIVDRDLFAPIVSKIEEMLGLMKTHEVIEIFQLLAGRLFRNHDLLTLLAEHLYRLQDGIKPIQIFRLTRALRKLSFYHPRLNKHIINCFVDNYKEFKDWFEVSEIVQFFSVFKTNSPTFWQCVADWMNLNLDNAADHAYTVQKMLTSCALVSVPTHLLKRPIEFTARELKNNPTVSATASKYLLAVHSLAILKSLSNYEANKVLQPEFFNELVNQYKGSNGDFSLLLIRSAYRILQIAAYCRYDLSIEPKIPSNVLDYLEKHADMGSKVRHGNSLETTVKSFTDHLYLNLPLESHVLSPRLHIPTGVFVDAFLWIDPETSKIIPIAEAEKTPNAEQVALIFASYVLLTNPDPGSEIDLTFPLSRPLGETKMNLRHLHAAKLKPVLIDHNEFEALQTAQQKIKYIKETIAAPYDSLNNKDWH